MPLPTPASGSSGKKDESPAKSTAPSTSAPTGSSGGIRSDGGSHLSGGSGGGGNSHDEINPETGTHRTNEPTAPYEFHPGPEAYSNFEQSDKEQPDNRTPLEKTLHSVQNQVYYLAQGKPLPPTYERIPQIVDAISWMESDSTWGQKVNGIFKSASSLLLTPEYVQAMSLLPRAHIGSEKMNAWDAVANPDVDPVMAAVRYAGVPGVIEAVNAKLDHEHFDPVAVEDQQNVSAYFHYTQGKDSAQMRDFEWAIFSSIPAKQQWIKGVTLEDYSHGASNVPTPTDSGLAEAPSTLELLSYGSNFNSPSVVGDAAAMGQAAIKYEGGVLGDPGRNYREELAGQAYLYRKVHPLQTPEDNEKYRVWLWRMAEQKKSEIEGRDSHLGAMGVMFDFGKNIVTKGLNDVLLGFEEVAGPAFESTFGDTNVPILSQIKAPSDELDLSQVSLGQNMALFYGMAPGDEPGWLGNDGFGGQVGEVIEHLPILSSPAGIIQATVAGVTGGGWDAVWGTPMWSVSFDQFNQGSNYEWFSGANDFLSWMYADPINYIAAIGMGEKAARTIPRAAELSRARAILEAVIPVYGKYASPVHTNAVGRMWWAARSKTISELVAVTRASESGKALWVAAETAANTEQFLRGTRGFNMSEDAAVVLMQAAKTGDEDLFWNILEVNMHGGLDRAPDVLKSRLTVVVDEGDSLFHRQLQGALDEGKIGLRDTMEPAAGVLHPQPFDIEVREVEPAVASVESKPVYEEPARLSESPEAVARLERIDELHEAPFVYEGREYSFDEIERRNNLSVQAEAWDGNDTTYGTGLQVEGELGVDADRIPVATPGGYMDIVKSRTSPGRYEVVFGDSLPKELRPPKELAEAIDRTEIMERLGEVDWHDEFAARDAIQRAYDEVLAEVEGPAITLGQERYDRIVESNELVAAQTRDSVADMDAARDARKQHQAELKAYEDAVKDHINETYGTSDNAVEAARHSNDSRVREAVAEYDRLKTEAANTGRVPEHIAEAAAQPRKLPRRRKPVFTRSVRRGPNEYPAFEVVTPYGTVLVEKDSTGVWKIIENAKPPSGVSAEVAGLLEDGLDRVAELGNVWTSKKKAIEAIERGYEDAFEEVHRIANQTWDVDYAYYRAKTAVLEALAESPSKPAQSATFLRVSQTEGDGARKAVVNSKRGFNTVESTDKHLLKWLGKQADQLDAESRVVYHGGPAQEGGLTSGGLTHDLNRAKEYAFKAGEEGKVYEYRVGDFSPEVQEALLKGDIETYVYGAERILPEAELEPYLGELRRAQKLKDPEAVQRVYTDPEFSRRLNSDREFRRSLDHYLGYEGPPADPNSLLFDAEAATAPMGRLVEGGPWVPDGAGAFTSGGEALAAEGRKTLDDFVSEAIGEWPKNLPDFYGRLAKVDASPEEAKRLIDKANKKRGAFVSAAKKGEDGRRYFDSPMGRIYFQPSGDPDMPWELVFNGVEGEGELASEAMHLTLSSEGLQGAVYSTIADMREQILEIASDSIVVIEKDYSAVLDLIDKAKAEYEAYVKGASAAQPVTQQAPNIYADLAAKLQQASDEILAGGEGMSLFSLDLTELTDEEIKIIRKYLDDISDADAFQHGDQLMLGKRATDDKLLYGNDMETRVNMYDALPEETRQQAINYHTRQVLANNGRGRVTLINAMPRVKTGSTFGQGAYKRKSWHNSNSRTSQWLRRTKSGWTTPEPAEISVTSRVEGGADMRRAIELVGLNDEARDELMTRWWAAKSDQERYELVLEMDRYTAEHLNDDPFMKYGFETYVNNRGEKTYQVRSADGKEIGAGVDSRGVGTIDPTLNSDKRTKVPIMSRAKIRRQHKRWLKAKRASKKGPVPRKVKKWFNHGLTKTTREKRESLVDAYKLHLKKTDPEALAKFTNDQLMEIAYADVMGFNGRKDGLGLVSRAASFGGSAYRIYHGAFTVAQLAFRPLPWAGRVLLEEQIRAGLMGLPTLMKNPTLYMQNMWDAHWINARVNAERKLLVKAGKAAEGMFFDDMGDLTRAMSQADEMLPGFAAKMAEAGITDPLAVRAQFSSELYHSLIGKPRSLSLESRGVMSDFTIFRSQRMRNRNEAILKRHRIKRDFAFTDDVPEIYNKFNVYGLAEEAGSSVHSLEWTLDMRPADVSNYADAYTKRVQRLVNDRNGQFALERTVEQMSGGVVTRTADQFMHTQAWREIKPNIENVARGRGLSPENISELELVEFYLDTILRDEWFGTLLKPFWGEDPSEKLRILTELSTAKQAEVAIGDKMFTLDARSHRFTDTQASHRTMFHTVQAEGMEFPKVSAYFDARFGNGEMSDWAKARRWPRKFTNFILEEFGERASMSFHRHPAYLFERRLWTENLTRLGWDAEAAEHFAHQKAFEMVNYTFFNNQHTGMIVNRMNKAIPFFSAWAEVISTWAYKIPAQNFLPLGYAHMMHSVDKVMQGFVKMGLVDIDESGQWRLNLMTDPDMTTAAGRGISAGLMEWAQAPVNVIETLANVGRWVGSEFNDEDYKPVDFSAWKKDNYQLAIGSPVRLNDHGIMGVNQLTFGLGPVLNGIGTAALSFIDRLPFAADTELVEGDTLADMYEKLPSDLGEYDFLKTNERALKEKLGVDGYNLLFQQGGFLVDESTVDVSGLALQVPGTSLMDSWLGTAVENTLFPYGHISSPYGLIRSLVPSTSKYMLLGLTGLHTNETIMPDGVMSVMFTPMDEYQVTGEVVKQIVSLENNEQLISEATLIASRLGDMVQLAGYGSAEEMREKLDPDKNPELSRKFVETYNDLELVNAEIIKRATDNAGMSILMRGLMGFMLPATPRMAYEEEKAKSQWWGTKELADAAAVRGSVSWGDMVGEVPVKDEEDLKRVLGLVAQWTDDPSGGKVKGWFKEQYPELWAWTTPTTFWAEGMAPPEQRNFDNWYDDLIEGNIKAYDGPIVIQKIARASIAATREVAITTKYGNDMAMQGVNALNDWDNYLDITKREREKRFALDMWDAEICDGAYDKWRSRTSDDKPVIYEKILDRLYTMRDVVDEMLAMADHSSISPQNQKTLNTELRKILRDYTGAVHEILDEMKGEDTFRNDREEVIGRYFAEHAGTYYGELQAVYDKLDDADTAEERSLIYEEARDVKNREYSEQHFLEVNGKQYEIPNEMDRTWSLRDEDEKQMQIKAWISRPAAWLDLFSSQKIVEQYPAADQYLPTTIADMEVYSEYTAKKRAIYDEARLHPESISTYYRNKSMQDAEDKLKKDLEKQGRHGEVLWWDAWPVEKMILTGTLPTSLTAVGEWYMGMKQELDALEKGPTSTEGRKRFTALFRYLDEEYLPSHPIASETLDDLGQSIFNEGGLAAIMARLYGIYKGEVN